MLKTRFPLLRVALGVAAIGGIALVLAPGIEEVLRFLPGAHLRIGPLWIVSAALCQWGVYVAITLILDQPLRRTGRRLPPGFLLPLSTLFLFANRALPGPAVAGLAVLTYRLRSRSVPVEIAHATAAVFYAADYLSFTILGALAAVYLLFYHRLGALHPGLLAAAMGIIGIGAALACVALRLRGWTVGFASAVAQRLARLLRREPGTWEAAARDRVLAFYIQWDEVTTHPGTLPATVALALAMHLFEVGTLWCCCRAFGGAVQPLYAAAGYVAGNLGAILSFLPGGAVLFEGGMIAALHGLAGMSLPNALAGTLLYRLLSIYLPLPFVLPALKQALSARP